MFCDSGRLGLVAGLIAVVVVVGCVSAAVKQQSDGIDLLGDKVGSEKETLAATILTSAMHSTPEKMMHILRTWRDHQISNLDPFESSKV